MNVEAHKRHIVSAAAVRMCYAFHVFYDGMDKLVHEWPMVSFALSYTTRMHMHDYMHMRCPPERGTQGCA